MYVLKVISQNKSKLKVNIVKNVPHRNHIMICVVGFGCDDGYSSDIFVICIRGYNQGFQVRIFFNHGID